MASSLLGLAPGGGYLAIHITADAGGLLHHLFTIAPTRPLPQIKDLGESWGGGSLFLWPYPAGSLLAEIPRPGCYPTLCSMECGLSSTPLTRSRDRPTDLRQEHHTRKETGR